MDILEKLAASARKRVEKEKKVMPLDKVAEKAEAQAGKELSEKGSFLFPFERALKKEGLSLICEVKKASPSKGIISPDFPYIQIAGAYEKGKADAMSVLTEPEYFLGSLDILEDIRKRVKTPILRKDFTVDEYMILQAKASGANAVLLICSILSDDELRCFYKLADSLGLSAVFEAHDENEIKRSAEAGARIIGVNNRNLRDFTINMDNSLGLEKFVPEGTVFISESGVKSVDDLLRLQRNGVDAALVGEALMRSEDPEARLSAWKDELKKDFNYADFH